MPDAGKTSGVSGDGASAVSLEGVSKIYPLYGNPGDRLKDAIGFHRWIPWLSRPKTYDFYALKDINLSIRPGERVGIVGRNGAGKTTLLKLVTENFAPSSGQVSVNGSVQALMQMGLGFNPEFTGYENIAASLGYNGLVDDALEAATKDVVDFVELDEFLHQPMKTYSLGMQARLQFAAATAIHPDIVIIDEVMGAGDAYFSAKSGRRMEALADTGCTLLLVSHSVQQMLQFCERVVWLDEGQIRMDGPALDVLTRYESHLEHRSEQIYLSEEPPQDPGQDPTEAPVQNAEEALETAQTDDEEFLVTLEDGRVVQRWPSNSGVKTIRLSMLSNNEPIEQFTADEPVEIEIEIICEEPGEYGLRYLLTFWRSDGLRAARLENQVDRFVFDAEEERRSIKIICPKMLLGPGKYDLSLSIYDLLNYSSSVAGRETRFDYLQKALPITVGSGKRKNGAALCKISSEWTFDHEVISCTDQDQG